MSKRGTLRLNKPVTCSYLYEITYTYLPIGT